MKFKEDISGSHNYSKTRWENDFPIARVSRRRWITPWRAAIESEYEASRDLWGKEDGKASHFFTF